MVGAEVGPMIDRREFAVMVPALLAGVAQGQFTGLDGKGAKPTGELAAVESGTYKPGPGYVPMPKRMSHRYLLGMLKAGNVRLEMHETIQEAGAEHEPVETHLHSEIWLVQRGKGILYINGTEHPLEAGDVGIVTAGDKHWVKNAGETEFAYFVVTVGPPEG
jgi:mannose-6-phosphate isomerase-like protein (cupin superfamily)